MLLEKVNIYFITCRWTIKHCFFPFFHVMNFILENRNTLFTYYLHLGGNAMEDLWWKRYGELCIKPHLLSLFTDSKQMQKTNIFLRNYSKTLLVFGWDSSVSTLDLFSSCFQFNMLCSGAELWYVDAANWIEAGCKHQWQLTCSLDFICLITPHRKQISVIWK